MSKSKSPTEWLIERLDYYLEGGEYHEYTPLEKQRHAQAILNHIEELVNEVIGSDEIQNWSDEDSFCEACNFQPSDGTNMCICRYRNILRNRQRTQAKQLIRGKD